MDQFPPFEVRPCQPEHDPALPHDPLEAQYTQSRRHPRVKCFVAVQLRPESDHGLVLGNLSHVGLGGCGVESANHVAEGTPVALSPLTAEGELWVKGVVVNTRFSDGTGSFHLGVRFLEEATASPEHLVKEFVAFVEQTAAKQSTAGHYPRGPWGI